jgi:hypothetical protein
VNQKMIACGVIGLTGLMAGCSFMDEAERGTAPVVEVPTIIKVPADHQVMMRTHAVGELTYECRPKANTFIDQFEWVFINTSATLYDINKIVVGKSYAGPTWEFNDGSKVTGKQIATAPSRLGAIPLQIVQASNASETGYLSIVTYIQRLNTIGGGPPPESCAAAGVNTQRGVPYEADYVFYKEW